MAVEDIKNTAVRLYEEVFNKGRVDALDEIVAPDYQEHDPLPGQGTGLSGMKDRVTMLRVGLAPQFTIEDVIADGDKVVVRWTNNGTHVADFLGMPATGRTFTIAGVDVYRVRGGKLSEHWHVVDMYSMLVQLGFVPAPGSA